MKYALIIIILFIIAVVALFIALGRQSKAGKSPGMISGHLRKCRATPNCVCSEYQEDSGHYIDPLLIPQGAVANTSQILRKIIQELGGDLQADTGDYLAATFASKIFGFIDDLEFRIDSTQNVVHVRSASRVGRSDLGVNKKRVEVIRGLYNKKAWNQ